MKTKRQLLSLLMVLSVLLGALPTAYASGITAPGNATTNAVLTTEELIMDVTVPTSVLIHVASDGTVTTPDTIPVVNNSVAPVFVHSLAVNTLNDWTLDPINNDYTGFKTNQKNYWLSFNGLDPSSKPIALATPITGKGTFNLVLSAGVAPQRTAINALNIGEIVITVDWDANEDAQEPVIPPETGFTVSDVYYVGDDIAIKYLPTVTGDLDVEVVSKVSGETVKTHNWRVDTLVGNTSYVPIEESFDKSIAYDVIVTLTGDDGKTYGPVTTVLSAKDNSETAPYTVNSVTHANLSMDEIVFDMTVNKPSQGFITVVPTGTDPTTGPSQNYTLNMFDLGTMRESIKIYNANYDSYVDNDVYITKDFDDFTDAIKVYLPARGTETGGAGDEGSTGSEFIPEGYTLATDDDFSGEANGTFKYIGTSDYVVIPHIIKGIPVTSYADMFESTSVKGVASDNPNITDMSNMFYKSKATTLDLSSFDTSNVENMFSMFRYSQATTLDLSSFDTSKVISMTFMFQNSPATEGYARTQEDADKFNASSGKPAGLTFVVK